MNVWLELGLERIAYDSVISWTILLWLGYMLEKIRLRAGKVGKH